MPWIDDLVTLMTEANLGTQGDDIFTSTKATITRPVSSGSILTIVETSGSAPERTQNSVIRPGYLRPAAQIVARSNNYNDARRKAQSAYDAVVGIRNSWIVGPVSSGWYREITPLQEPFDMGVDDRKQARCGFNVIAIRRPDGSGGSPII